ncbi:NAD-dependent epimerase/dehydratase family protein [Terrihabitans rhizophilus]|uniref:NAD-dependent epimerase/dehydratase family protein n=1 Tax=Terrihabitans rhizophilus TaxID=3092662 RepID=A0ABU4RMJ7_9HYPH|nr:NAD-dependent epimerase/dehydratase family protein [Terrihabitans sp. PJ23]MDX6805443.1 NAD-dependent epimerase/dehydratase family protein [Terrihabitans sp. PJ23]
MARYLVTGGAGFIGRHLCRQLLDEGHEIRVVDSLVEQVHGGQPRADVLQHVEFIQGDLRNRDVAARAVDGVDAVYHLAAEVGVGQSMYEIERYVGGNDLATANLLQELIAKPVERIVVASSMSVYGEGLYVTPHGTRVENAVRTGDQVKSRTWDPVGPNGEPLTPIATDETKQISLSSIYALTKFVQEQEVLITARAYGMGAVALRLFNVFGPGQALSNPYTGVLAIFASRLLNHERPMIFEDGKQMRDFVHVDDVARAFQLAMNTPEANGETMNIGAGEPHTVQQVGQLLAGAMGREIEPEILNEARSGDIRHCFGDLSKAERVLGFKPQYKLSDKLGELAEWVARQQATDRARDARKELEARGLVV